MPVGSITNNFGYQFDLTESRQDTLKIQVKDKFGIDQGAAEYVYITDLTFAEQSLLEACPNLAKSKLIQKFIEERLSSISSQTSTRKSHQIQYYIHEGHRWVILGNSGLLGGVARRATALVFSTLGILAGAGLTAFTGGGALPVLFSAGLTGGGLRSLVYSATTPEEEISISGHLTQATSGFAGGVGGALATAFAPATLAAIPIPKEAIEGMVGNIGQVLSSSATEAVIQQDLSILENQLNPRELIRTAAIGTLSGTASRRANDYVTERMRSMASQSNIVLRNPVLTSAAIGGVAGAASNLCAKTIENLIKRANFLQISDRAPSTRIVPDRLYVYPRSDANIIVFLSIINGRPLATEIRNLSKFGLNRRITKGIKFSNLLNKLRKGKVDLSQREKTIILQSAYRHGHIPPSITKDFGQAAVIGAISGTATELGRVAGDRMRQRQTAGQKRSRDTVDENPRPLKTRRDQEEEEDEATTQACQSTHSPQIQAIEGQIQQLETQQKNLQDLAGYSSLDIQNKATQIYNNANNSRTYGDAGTQNIQKQLSDLFGIPLGTNSSSFEEAYKGRGRNKDTYVVQVIVDILQNEQRTNAVSNRVNQSLTEARSNLHSLQDPTSSWTSLSQLNTTPVAPPSILELITDSENVARVSGFEGNIHVRIYYLATYLAGGVDYSPLFNEIHNRFSAAHSYWEQHRHERNAPTEYGFLTYVTDHILNGKSTVPVEHRHNRWYNKALDAIGGKVSIGVQTDGETHTIGTMDRPDLFRLPLPGSTNSEQITSMNDSSGSSSGGVLTTEQYGTLEITGNLLENLNRIPGAQGLGTYARHFVGRLTRFLGFLDRMGDSDYQEAPFIQRSLCAVAGTAVEGAGTAIFAIPWVTSLSLLFPDRALAMMKGAEQEGNHAQNMCNKAGDWIRN